MSTPFHGSAKPFQIGLKPLDPRRWTVPGAQLGDYLAQKRRLLATRRNIVFATEPGTEAAQAELLGRLASHFVADHPALYRREGTRVIGPEPGIAVALDDDRTPALERAALLVEDDLVLMRRGEAGWRIAAAALCFPSAWSLAQKFGRPMHEVHAPVPGFGAGTRNAELITRMFDNLRPEMPMIRWNWSLFGDGALHHPEGGHPDRPRFGDGVTASHAFLRVERQTLTRLPESRDIVFSIGIHVDPLEALGESDEGPRLARTLHDQIAALGPHQLSYKGLALEREAVLRRLRELAG
jgi:dimethylamine monooxygenase subunit A